MTGMGRETGLAKDQGQETPRMPGMLNPGGFGVMTEIQEMQSPWWGGETSGHNGLPCDCRRRYREDAKSGRNNTVVVQNTLRTIKMDLGANDSNLPGPIV